MTNFELIYEAIKPNVTEIGVRKLFIYAATHSSNINKAIDCITSNDEIPEIDKNILFNLCVKEYSNDNTKVESIEDVRIDTLDRTINVKVNTLIRRYANPEDISDYQYSKNEKYNKEIWKTDYDWRNVDVCKYVTFANAYTNPPVEEISK